MKSIVIAEDNPANRELLRELLMARGYTVVEAGDGEEALDVVKRSKPDLLLLDLGMPGMDGVETIRRIRGDRTLSDLPVVAVTAYAMRGDREKILEAGFDGYLAKPIDPHVLDAELRRIEDAKFGEDESGVA